MSGRFEDAASVCFMCVLCCLCGGNSEVDVIRCI
jgi:hypothetical protein